MIADTASNIIAQPATEARVQDSNVLCACDHHDHCSQLCLRDRICIVFLRWAMRPAGCSLCGPCPHAFRGALHEVAVSDMLGRVGFVYAASAASSNMTMQTQELTHVILEPGPRRGEAFCHTSHFYNFAARAPGAFQY